MGKSFDLRWIRAAEISGRFVPQTWHIYTYSSAGNELTSYTCGKDNRNHIFTDNWSEFVLLVSHGARFGRNYELASSDFRSAGIFHRYFEALSYFTSQRAAFSVHPG
jgi:dTDP-D-glucose 4,6-dehydratase